MLLNFFPGFVSKIEKLLLTQLIKNVLLRKTVQNVFFSRQMSLRTGDRGERQYMVVNVPGFVLEINISSITCVFILLIQRFRTCISSFRCMQLVKNICYKSLLPATFPNFLETIFFKVVL